VVARDELVAQAAQVVEGVLLALAAGEMAGVR
jgi:hypothetical protein